MRHRSVSAMAAASLGLLLGMASSLSAQPALSVGPLSCLPQQGNAVLAARVAALPAGATTRLYFRRMSLEVEDFYFVEMRPAADGSFWAVFPRPTVAKAVRKELDGGERDLLWAQWWRNKEASQDRDPNRDLDRSVIQERASLGKQEARSWMSKLDDKAFEQWLESLENEPAEYYVAVYDAAGRLLAKSDVGVAPVTGQCHVQLTPQQAGYAANLTVGETSTWQAGKEPFHWQCDGLVTRLDPQGVLRADDTCRACVIAAAWWQNPAILVPVAGGITAITLISIEQPTPVSPSRP